MKNTKLLQICCHYADAVSHATNKQTAQGLSRTLRKFVKLEGPFETTPHQHSPPIKSDTYLNSWRLLQDIKQVYLSGFILETIPDPFTMRQADFTPRLGRESEEEQENEDAVVEEVMSTRRVDAKNTNNLQQ